jgi:RecA/RadA recombinase
MNVYAKFRSMMDNHIILSFKGEITSDIITMVLQIIESRLEAEEAKSSVKKKIFNVLVECMQNLYHHAEAEVEGEFTTRKAMLEMYFDDSYYNIITGNFMKNEEVEKLKTRLDKVNSLSKDELRQFYREILDNNQISKKGGANLGMIDMARKSGEKLEYHFTQVNDKLTFFDLRVRVSKNKKKEKAF